jgi:hypothetical protein
MKDGDSGSEDYTISSDLPTRIRATKSWEELVFLLSDELIKAAGMREALSRIQDIVKPTDYTMSGPRWDGGAGGNKQKIWEICEYALTKNEPK